MLPYHLQGNVCQMVFCKINVDSMLHFLIAALLTEDMFVVHCVICLQLAAWPENILHKKQPMEVAPETYRLI